MARMIEESALPHQRAEGDTIGVVLAIVLRDRVAVMARRGPAGDEDARATIARATIARATAGLDGRAGRPGWTAGRAAMLQTPFVLRILLLRRNRQLWDGAIPTGPDRRAPP
ncbi:MAG: hypothetical protein GW886_02805 [Rhodobacterales bacterium]|nr:hypothetical protein [Rhodobacterales bacterium]